MTYKTKGVNKMSKIKEKCFDCKKDITYEDYHIFLNKKTTNWHTVCFDCAEKNNNRTYW